MKILVLAVKELKTIFRETGGLFFMFLMPVALLIVFNLIFGGAYSTGPSDSPFRLPVVNQDEGDMGAVLLKQLEAIEWIRVEHKFTEDDRPFTAEDIEGLEVIKKGDALHKQCIGCHDDAEAGPRECASCHKMQK